MAVQQMNISISPQMAKYIHRKVKTGGYTNASEVVRTAVRRMQEEERRDARLARTAAEDIIAQLTDAEMDTIRGSVRAGFQSIARGQFKEYVGREGLNQLAAEVKGRGRKLLAKNRS